MAQNTIADLSGTFSSNLDFLGQSMQGGAGANTIDTIFQKFAALIARFYSDLGGTGTVGGTANAITLTSASTYQTLTNGLVVAFKATATNTAAATFKLDSLTAKDIVLPGGAAVGANAILSGTTYLLRYDSAIGSGVWLLLSSGAGGAPPVGTVVPFAGSAAPGSGWLLCYGQAVSRTTYAALFAALGTTYGAGDGSTTFALPDLRGRVVAGKDDMGGSSANRLTNQTGGLNGDTLGATGGAETHQLTIAQLAAHAHRNGTSTSQSGTNQFTISAYPNSAGQLPIGETIGGDEAHNNVQPTIIVNYIIFAGA